MKILVDADAVDFALINLCQTGDIVVSQDYGVAAMALGKQAFAIHQSGQWYTNDNTRFEESLLKLITYAKEHKAK